MEMPAKPVRMGTLIFDVTQRKIQGLTGKQNTQIT